MKKKIITKTPKDIQKEKDKDLEDRTCPICGYDGWKNESFFKTVKWEGSFLFGKYVSYSNYTCVKCGCEWQIKEDD